MLRRRVAPLLAAAVVLAACSPSAPSTPGPTGPTSTGPAPTIAGPTDAPPSPGSSLPGKTETDWGPIWNDIPPSFPIIDGAEPAESETGPTSAAFTVAKDVLGAQQIAEFYRDAFDNIGLGTGLDGPLEDGSFTAWASTGYGCDVLVTALPRGDESYVTILYGTGCPYA